MNLSSQKKIEVLAPAGDKERFLAAVSYGADAVYLAGQEFGMRAAPENFDTEQLAWALDYAHAIGKKVYITCNTVPRNDEIERLPDFLKLLQKAGADGVIVSDIGVMSLALKYAPDVEVHISTQTGVCNYATANRLYEMGAKRVVLARELSLDEIKGIRDKTPPKLDIECFVHGAMCVSFSGRCLLSNVLTGRDANRGDCAQPCRWKYVLSETTRENTFFPVMETEKGTYILNSRDMCMIKHIDRLYDAGINSFKIEGRAKSAYYTAAVTNAYRMAVDDYLNCQGHFVLPDWIEQEVYKVSHREYSTGFYFGNEPGQVCESGGYIRNYDVVALVTACEDGWLYLSQRNKFLSGDELDVLMPGTPPFIIKVNQLYTLDGQPIDSAPHATMDVKIRCDRNVAVGAYLRKKI